MPTIEEYQEMSDDLAGWCSHCKKIVNHGSVEPDAEHYTCEECGNPTVKGSDNLLIDGDIY